MDIVNKPERRGSAIPYGNTQRPNNRAPYARHVVIVTSGKGGVGKSTVTVNLASVLARRGLKVGLLDGDVYGPSIPRMLQVENERLHWNEQNRIVPSENFGIRIMSAGLTTPQSDTPLIWRSSVATAAMIQLLEDVEWGELDYLIIDMPPGTGDSQLTMAQELHIDAAVVVSTPQTVATDDVCRAIRMLQEIRAPIGGLVENMSGFVAPDTGVRYPIFGENGGKMLAEHYGIPFLGEVPLDMGIRQSSDEGRPFVLDCPDEAARVFESIGDQVVACCEARKASRSLEPVGSGDHEPVGSA